VEFCRRIEVRPCSSEGFIANLNFKMSLEASFSKLIGFSLNEVFPTPQIIQRQLEDFL
jgi:hypothetical protein